MNFQPTQTYGNQGVDSLLRQQVYRQNVPGYQKIWPKVSNVALLLCPFVLMASLWLSDAITNLDKALRAAENVRHELTENQINLLTIRDELRSPDHILMFASQNLALQLPEEEQVKKID